MLPLSAFENPLDHPKQEGGAVPQGGGGNLVSSPLIFSQCHSSGEDKGFFLTDKGNWRSRFSTWPLLIERGPTFSQCYLSGRLWLFSKYFCLGRQPILKFFAKRK